MFCKRNKKAFVKHWAASYSMALVETEKPYIEKHKYAESLRVIYSQDVLLVVLDLKLSPLGMECGHPSDMDDIFRNRLEALETLYAHYNTFNRAYKDLEEQELDYDSSLAKRWGLTGDETTDIDSEGRWCLTFEDGSYGDQMSFSVELVALKSYHQFCAVSSLQRAWRNRKLQKAKTKIEEFLISYMVYAPGSVMERRGSRDFYAILSRREPPKR